MINRKNIPVAILIMSTVLVLAVLLSGCTSPTPAPGTTPTPTPVPQTDITVFAAASLGSAFNQTIVQFELLHPEINVLPPNYGSSGTLQTNIEQGAKTDVFASAATSNMDALKSKNLMDNSTVVNFARNKLALIVPINNPANITGLTDLNKSGIKMIIGADSVPCGKYAVQMLQKLRNTSGYGSAYYDAAWANIKSRATDVSAIVASIALGEGDVGIVYASDVQEKYQNQVKIIAIPDALNVIATYPIGVTADSSHKDAAKAFIDFVMSPAGQAILAENDFMSPPAAA